VIIGVAVIAVALIASIVLSAIADGRRADTIAGFARAPAGCDTTLVFDATGRYLLFAETEGTLDAIRGDCDLVGSYFRPEAPPAFEIAIVGPDGSAVPVGERPDVDYDASGYVGTAVGEVQIDAAGQYVLRVASDADDFVVAVGTDPDGGGVDSLRLAAGLVFIVGVLAGGVLIVMGVFRRVRARTAPPAAADPWAVPAAPAPSGRGPGSAHGLHPAEPAGELAPRPVRPPEPSTNVPGEPALGRPPASPWAPPAPPDTSGE
jgi:hypothetical protein